MGQPGSCHLSLGWVQLAVTVAHGIFDRLHVMVAPGLKSCLHSCPHRLVALRCSCIRNAAALQLLRLHICCSANTPQPPVMHAELCNSLLQMCCLLLEAGFLALMIFTKKEEWK